MKTMTSHPQEFKAARFRSDLPRQSITNGYLLCLLEPDEQNQPLAETAKLISRAFEEEVMMMGKHWSEPLKTIQLLAFKETADPVPDFTGLELAYHLEGQSDSKMHGKVRVFKGFAAYFIMDSMEPIPSLQLDRSWTDVS
jgi:hypothetical protein